MSKSKVKPCPFCGTELENIHTYIAETGAVIIEWAEHPDNACFLSEWEFNEMKLDLWNGRWARNERAEDLS